MSINRKLLVGEFIFLFLVIALPLFLAAGTAPHRPVRLASGAGGAHAARRVAGLRSLHDTGKISPCPLCLVSFESIIKNCKAKSEDRATALCPILALFLWLVMTGRWRARGFSKPFLMPDCDSDLPGIRHCWKFWTSAGAAPPLLPALAARSSSRACDAS